MDRPAALRSFWRQPLGTALLAAESELLAEALDDVFGWEFLQVGAWGEGHELLSGCRTRRRAVVAPAEFTRGADIIARPSQLPVARDSVDAVLLPHTLEFATDPYAILREVDRVLAGDGQLVVLGFSPLSLWGARALGSQAGFPPGIRRVLSPGRVREWLVLLGYEVTATRAYLHHQPWGGSSDTALAAEQMLHRAWYNPLPAGAWMLKVRKRVYTLTPTFRPRFRDKPAVVKGRPVVPTTLVKPTPRQSG